MRFPWFYVHSYGRKTSRGAGLVYLILIVVCDGSGNMDQGSGVIPQA